MHTVTTKVCDEQIDLSEVKPLFESARDNTLDCEMVLVNGNRYDWVRISKAEDDSCDALIMLGNSSLRKKFKYSDILMFKVKSSGEELASKKDATRFSILDTPADEI